MTDIDQYIKKCDNPRANLPKVALPPHLRSYNASHVARAGLTPLGQIVKPERAHYVNKDLTKQKVKPSARPALMKRIKLKK